MAIEFNGLQSTPTNGTRAKNPSPESDASKAQPQTDATQTSTPDTVQLSAEAQTLKKLEAQVAELPDVNADKVAQLKEAIDNGSYKVNPESVARGLLQVESLFEA